MGKKVALKVGGKELEVSNLDKVLFPQTGFTKGEIINYYVQISEFILPHLKNRPLTLKRYPNGVMAEKFYEKDAPSHKPSWVKTAPIWRVSGESQIHYILLNDLPSLVWSANLANIEMHVFLAKAPKVDRPTMVVFDLDPGEGATAIHSCQVALWLRAELEKLKLKSWVKFSGSKGLHLHIPLNTATTYEQTQPFAKALAEHLTATHPELVVADMAKILRKRKVLVDWSQNSDYKTTVAVYSMRGKPDGPFVSVPLTWKEIEQAVKTNDAGGFYVRPAEMIHRLKKSGDTFAPVLKVKQKIPKNWQSILSRPAPAQKKKAAASRKSLGKLSAYNAKRNFGVTAEPAGEEAPSNNAKEHMFVIQKHAASHLHYDFRLEMQGVLRSWAVPKGPPYTQGESRLAMHVEDHPMDYARFEGTIPKGQYGGGTVMVWDIGTYTVKADNPAKAYYSGKIPMELRGKKLKGEWTLVRTHRDDGGKEKWLLIKTGASVRALSAKKDDESVLTGRPMEKIAHANDAVWNSDR